MSDERKRPQVERIDCEYRYGGIGGDVRFVGGETGWTFTLRRCSKLAQGGRADYQIAVYPPGKMYPDQAEAPYEDAVYRHLRERREALEVALESAADSAGRLAADLCEDLDDQLVQLARGESVADFLLREAIADTVPDPSADDESLERSVLDEIEGVTAHLKHRFGVDDIDLEEPGQFSLCLRMAAGALAKRGLDTCGPKYGDGRD